MNETLYKYRPSVEMFLIRGNLVAQQQAYSHAYLKETYYEVKHFYCPICGDAWGLRVDNSARDMRHHFYSSECKDCGGEQNMLTPWEQDNIDILGPNVLAYLILSLTTTSGGQS
jgi:predicted RNA-binding Zn-ribbon protein involved in translation (DUF1610 family)